MSPSIPTTGTKSPCPFCHLGVALPPRQAKVSNLPYSLCFSKLTCCRSTKAHVPLSLGAKEEKALSSPKPCMGTQSLSRWEAQRKTTRHRQKCNACVCHTLLHFFLALLFTNLKVKEVLGMKKRKAEEGCRKSLVMHSLHPLDSLARERESRIHCPLSVGCHNPQTPGSGSLIPVPAQCQDKVLGLSLLKSQHLVQIRRRSLSAHFRVQHWETRI